MKTLTDEGEQSTKKTVDRSAKKKKVSFPVEIIEDIILRLPVQSILRFRSVSKPWLSRISDPSFAKLHLTRPHRTALFFSAYDKSTRKKHFLSASIEGGPVTHLMTLDDVHPIDITKAQHLNGLVCFAYIIGSCCPQVFVVNPSTHHIFKLPLPDHPSHKGCYLFGFDESQNEHKILFLRRSYKSAKAEIMIFSMSDYSWRKIYVEPPVGFNWYRLVRHYKYGYYYSVCVNSVVHLMLSESYDILGFDLRTEKFSIINTPQGVAPHVSDARYIKDGEYLFKDNEPCFININGCIGVVCHDRVLEKNEMHIWILQDYENCVWIKEIITFPKSWIKLDMPFPVGSVNMDEVIFLKSKMFRNVANSVSIYNRKSRCFKDLQFASGHQFPLSTTMQVSQLGGYVESMVPL